ncbi:MAG: class I SAM-dependent methyltransferase [Sedimenticolaceae bacterium]
MLAAAGSPLKPGDQLLDLGCGSGEIAAQLATRARVICCDAIDQRTQGVDLPFTAVGVTLPFANASFDVVVSNHVIEHLPDAAIHVAEIRRVLRPGGIAYLATPNRWWPWEFHTRLPLLHFLPTELFSPIGRHLGRLDEPLQLLSLRRLRQLTRTHFAIDVWHTRILHAPTDYALNISPAIAAVLRALPQPLLDASAGLQPTLILVLRIR